MALNINGNGVSGDSPTIKNFQDSDYKNVISIATSYPIATGGSGPTPQTPVNGRVFGLTTSATLTTDLQLQTTQSGTLVKPIRTFSWSSTNLSVATINSAGYVTQIGSGDSSFRCATTDPTYTANFPHNFTTSGGQTVSTFYSWQLTSPVSLPYHMNSQVDDLITAAGSFSSSKLNLYSSINDTTGTYVRNTSVWTGALDLSAIPTWSSFATTEFFGALITPTDMIVANHVLGALNPPTVLRFVDSSNITYVANCTSTRQINGDLAIAHLSWVGTLPTTLNFLKVLPSNYQTYCPDHLLNFFPVIGTNQFRQVFVQDSSQPSNGSTSSFGGGMFTHFPSTSVDRVNRVPWTLNVVNGDSSNPIMVVINDQPVLICCNFSANTGPTVSDNIAAINSGLAMLGSSYTVSTVNLSSPITFPTY